MNQIINCTEWYVYGKPEELNWLSTQTPTQTEPPQTCATPQPTEIRIESDSYFANTVK